MLEILEELGLSSAEAKVYLALLDLGESKTGPLIDSTKLQSSTVYHVLGSLIEKGLVQFILKGKIKYYQAADPNNLSLFLEEKKTKLDGILPELKLKQSQVKQQSAKIYQGIKGLHAAYQDILLTMKKGEEYYFYQLSVDDIHLKRTKLFFRNYHLKRSEKGIKVKGLSQTGTKELMGEIYTDLKWTKIKYVDEFIPTGLVVYKNKVITLDLQDEPVAFVIENEHIAESYRKFFEEKWKEARK